MWSEKISTTERIHTHQLPHETFCSSASNPAVMTESWDRAGQHTLDVELVLSLIPKFTFLFILRHCELIEQLGIIVRGITVSLCFYWWSVWPFSHIADHHWSQTLVTDHQCSKWPINGQWLIIIMTKKQSHWYLHPHPSATDHHRSTDHSLITIVPLTNH